MCPRGQRPTRVTGSRNLGSARQTIPLPLTKPPLEWTVHDCAALHAVKRLMGWACFVAPNDDDVRRPSTPISAPPSVHKLNSSSKDPFFCTTRKGRTPSEGEETLCPHPLRSTATVVPARAGPGISQRYSFSSSCCKC